MAGSSKTTTDHEVIQKWIEERGGTPSCVRGTGDDHDAGLLRVNFPGYTGEDRLEDISWDEFFQKFDEKHLVFLYQEELRDGGESRFFKFVSESTAHDADAGHDHKNGHAKSEHKTDHKESDSHVKSEYKTDHKDSDTHAKSEHKDSDTHAKAEHKTDHKDSDTHAKAEHKTTHKDESEHHAKSEHKDDHKDTHAKSEHKDESKTDTKHNSHEAKSEHKTEHKDSHAKAEHKEHEKAGSHK